MLEPMESPIFVALEPIESPILVALELVESPKGPWVSLGPRRRGAMIDLCKGKSRYFATLTIADLPVLTLGFLL